MPIEIRELIIKAIVEEKPGANATEADTGAEGKGKKDKIITECVEQVMEILNAKMER